MKLTHLYIVLCVLASCSMSHHHTIQSSYAEDGRFEQYQSYSIVSNVALAAVDRQAVEKGIASHMNSLGYQIDSKNPSIYIYYQSYTEDFKLKTDNQPSLENWLARKEYFQEEEKKDKQTSPTMIYGNSLFISFYDPALQKEIWNGHVSNMHNSRSYNNQAAAQVILQQYQLMSKGSQIEEFRHFALR
ncbi:DUF4136 domain-containing protein [Reichenbachiella agarivorans]|uniref:DUF4136 domain-containing protein n=1 Tax=Reichenbachiella agarivorans TaxID=2979464 RepID=A0ABY6CQV5_9BACT|nr:DUF4136 domain-containing protein [Reichenbachiella agarivorans]UXP32204.1 DUF4136 domain-containing protein [Reichenbachiella agarivorans]